MKLLPSEKGTGSGNGWTYWKRWLECALRSKLDEEGDQNDALRIGTYFHQLTEAYDTNDENTALEFQIINANPAWERAVELFKGYRDRHPPAEFGELLGVEKWYEGGGGDKEACLARYGAWPFTGQVDRLYRVSEDDAIRLSKDRPALGFLTPGVYLLDYKTSSKGGKGWITEHKYSCQFVGYAMLLEENEPELYKEFQGTIIQGAIKHKVLKDESFPAFWIPAPKKRERKILHNTLSLCYNRMLTEGDAANPAYCGNWGGCKHLFELGGSCKRGA